MFNKPLVASFLVSASLVSTTSFAYEAKPYIFGNIGGAKVDLDVVEDGLDDLTEVYNASGVSTSTNVDDTSFAFSLGVGVQLHRNFALELGYYDLGSYEANASANYSDSFVTAEESLKGEAEASGYGLQGVILVPFSDKFSGTVSAGVARIKTEVKVGYSYDYKEVTGYTEADSYSFRESSTDTVGTFGLGARYAVNKDVSLRADYTYFDNIGDKETTGETSVDMLTVGLNYNF